MKLWPKVTALVIVLVIGAGTWGYLARGGNEEACERVLSAKVTEGLITAYSGRADLESAGSGMPPECRGLDQAALERVFGKVMERALGSAFGVTESEAPKSPSEICKAVMVEQAPYRQPNEYWSPFQFSHADGCVDLTDLELLHIRDQVLDEES